MKKDPSRELAIRAADLASDGKALDITVLELRDISSVADYFVLANGRSHIQVEAICDRIVEGLDEDLQRKPISVEGLENAQWAVLDYGSVVIHVFQESVRKLYDLDRLWSLAPQWKYDDGPMPVSPAKAPAATAGAGPKIAKKAASTAGKKTAAGAAGKKPAAGARTRAAGGSDSTDDSGTSGTSKRIARA